MSKYSRLGRNTLLVFVGNIGSKLITFLMLPFYTAWLSVSEYGITDLVGVYVSFLLGIVTFCMVEAIFVFPKDKDNNIQKTYFSSGLFFTLISAVITGFVFYIVDVFFLSKGITNTFTEYKWTIYLFLIATFLQAYTQQFSRSINKVSVYAISGVVLTLATAALSFAFIPRYGLNGYFIAQILSLTISCIYTFFASKSYNFLSLNSISKKSYKEMLVYSIPLIPNGIMWWVVSALNRPIMEEVLGMQDIGLFAVANKFPSIIMILFSVFSYSWQISVLEEFHKKGYKEFYNRMIRFVFFILIVLSCGLSSFSSIVIAVADVKFVQASEYIPLLSFAVVFSSFSGMVGTNFSAVRKSKYYFYSSVWGGIVSILLNFLLIPVLGLLGASLSIVLAHFVMAVIRLKFSWKYVHLENILKYFQMILVNILVIVIGYYSADIIHRIICYFVAIGLLTVINRDLYPVILELYTKGRKL